MFPRIRVHPGRRTVHERLRVLVVPHAAALEQRFQHHCSQDIEAA